MPIFIVRLFLVSAVILVFSQCGEAQTALETAKKDGVVKKHVARLTEEFTKKDLHLGNPVFFRIFKEADGYDSGCLELWVKKTGESTYELFKTYTICTFSGGLGTKNKEGDGKTPEGCYLITSKRINQYSSYHRAFNIGYPNRYERLKGYTGSYIMIHGACCSIGCIAMGDENIEEIWTIGIKALAGGSNIKLHILPFELNEETIDSHKNYPDSAFLQELKTAYDYFETHKFPPQVNAVKSGTTVKYTFK